MRCVCILCKMSKKPIVHLLVNPNSKYLLHWLDFHKSLFSNGFVNVIGLPTKEEREYVKRAVNKFVPHWVVIENREDVISDKGISLTPNEFLFATDLNQPIVRYNAHISNKEGPIPNNIVDLLSSILQSVTLSNDGNEDEDEGSNELTILATEDEDPKQSIQTKISAILKSDYVYYLDAFLNCDWGENKVILAGDINLLENTDFNDTGYKIVSMDPHHAFLKNLFETKIAEITGRSISAEDYHLHISAEEHTKILNAMPYKKDESLEMAQFCSYIENRVSSVLGQRVKIFNDDVWVRVCRPSSVSSCDYNPCHRDIYLDFYRNIVNIYIPIVGSNERSSLAMESGSHLWNEQDVMVTRGGAYFETSKKKYSVDAIVQSKRRLNMVRPNPNPDEFILFSPYLIHGCSSNDNANITRASIEIRFILDTEESKKQEAEFNAFLKERIWR